MFLPCSLYSPPVLLKQVLHKDSPLKASSVSSVLDAVSSVPSSCCKIPRPATEEGLSQCMWSRRALQSYVQVPPDVLISLWATVIPRTLVNLLYQCHTWACTTWELSWLLVSWSGVLHPGTNSSRLDVSAIFRSYVVSPLHRTARSSLSPRITRLDKEETIVSDKKQLAPTLTYTSYFSVQ